MKLRPIKPEQSNKEFFTSHSGLSLLGLAIKLSRLDEQLQHLGRYRGISHVDIVKTYLGLLAIGKNDFEAAENMREDKFFQAALGIERVPSSSRLRQRMDDEAMAYARALDEANICFLERTGASVSPIWTGHVPLDMDLFPQDNSGTKKEGVSYTYKGYDGYGVMAAYLGTEGWNLACDLKPGSENGQLGFGFVLDRVLPSARRMTGLPLLLRLDSGHDALENRVRSDEEAVDFIIKWNPRKQSAQAWLEYAEQLGHWADWTYPRPGKRVVTFTLYETRIWQGREQTHRRVMRVVERSIDKKGQPLLIPELEVEGWWTSLDLPDETIIALYRDHATSEQFHSEFKTDLDLERLPSGKLETNTLVMVLGTFVYNVLRLIGLVGLIGEHSPIRHAAKRRRIRTVMQELFYLAGKFYERGHQLWLRFSCHCPAFTAFQKVNAQLVGIGSG
jgi:hypothetical protein